jgi:hypothetical protein
MLDRLPCADPAQDEIFFGQPLLWNDDGDRPADDLLRRVPEQSLGSLVPGLHDAVEVLADDRIVRILDDGGEAQGVPFRSAYIGDLRPFIG